MQEYDCSFLLSTYNGYEIAVLHMTRFTCVVVGVFLDEWKDINIDCLNYLGDGVPASWNVTVDDDIEAPVWNRRPTYEAEERARAIRARRQQAQVARTPGDRDRPAVHLMHDVKRDPMLREGEQP